MAIATSFTASEAQVQSWLRQFGGFSDQYTGGLVKSGSGGVFVGGGTLGGLFAPSLGSEDIFLAEYDGFGNLLWGVQFGTSATDTGGVLASDGMGGVFITGQTSGSFGGPNAGGWDGWLARCDGSGARLWVRQIGTAATDDARAVAEDGGGGVFVAGITWGELVPPSAGTIDVWMAHYDNAGGRSWLRQFGTPSFEGPNEFATDGTGGFFACGGTGGSLFGPHSGGVGDAWLARFDASGLPIWARQFGTPMGDSALALCRADAGGVFVAGFTDGPLGGPALGDLDAWIARYDGSGNQLAIAQFGTTGSDFAKAVAPDSFGGAFVSGDTTGAFGAPNAGLADAWVARVGAGLTMTWVEQLGSPYYETASALAAAGPGSVFVGGYTDGNIITGGGSGGSSDAWLARYDLCYPDCNADGVLAVPDFGCFQTRFLTADPYADCNADGVLTVADFGCFQTKFVAGCP